MGTNARMQADRAKALQAGFYSTEIEDKFSDSVGKQYLNKIKKEVEVYAQFAVLSTMASNTNAETAAMTREGAVHSASSTF